MPEQPRRLLVDTHNDLPFACHELAGHDWTVLDLDAAPTHTDIPRLRAGGVGAQFWSVFVAGTLPGHEAVTATLEQIDATHRLVRLRPELQFARTADDIERIHAAGRIASLMGAEGGHSIACSLGVLRMLHALGVGYLTLTHNEHVPWADCAVRPERLGGLSAFGRAVVDEMNRLGMLVDLSHVSPGTMRDALDASSAPVIFTHSNARSLTDHPRNVPDDVLRATAEAGGVCCATFVPAFCSQERYDWERDVIARAETAGIDAEDDRALEAFVAGLGETPPPVGVHDVADHVDRLREVAGVEHVGIGGDFDGTSVLPDGLEDVSTYPRLLGELAARGWSDGDLDLLAGRNVLRVMRAAEDVARERVDESPSLARIAELDGVPDGVAPEFAAVVQRTW
ncbi:dipeptidase [Mobilicoccus massiliensis]|uniref:dipeptidase n=1 Tax=Mobilicoccus massiliensis TaxID=1522310 RepID=UPI00058B7AD5|nr:dipeptidase [Mobilicoccus massiliensis]